MKNASIIIGNIISDLPQAKKRYAREIIECRFLAQLNAKETALYLGIPFNIVIDTLQEIKSITKGKTLSDFT